MLGCGTGGAGWSPPGGMTTFEDDALTDIGSNLLPRRAYPSSAGPREARRPRRPSASENAALMHGVLRRNLRAHASVQAGKLPCGVGTANFRFTRLRELPSAVAGSDFLARWIL